MFGYKGAPLYGRLLASAENIRLCWKSLPGTNALANYEKAKLTAVKFFIRLAVPVRCPSPFSSIREKMFLALSSAESVGFVAPAPSMS
jgi:hypothetical protein